MSFSFLLLNIDCELPIPKFKPEPTIYVLSIINETCHYHSRPILVHLFFRKKLG